MPKMTFIEKNGEPLEVEAPNGLSVMEISHKHGIDIEGACGGCLACATCHARDGPPLQGLYRRRVPLSDGSVVLADDAYIRRSIVDPASQIVQGYQPIMPTFASNATEEEILQLIAYIRSLKNLPPGSLPSNAPNSEQSPNDDTGPERKQQ